MSAIWNISYKEIKLCRFRKMKILVKKVIISSKPYCRNVTNNRNLKCNIITQKQIAIMKSMKISLDYATKLRNAWFNLLQSLGIRGSCRKNWSYICVVSVYRHLFLQLS